MLCYIHKRRCQLICIKFTLQTTEKFNGFKLNFFLCKNYNKIKLNNYFLFSVSLPIYQLSLNDFGPANRVRDSAVAGWFLIFCVNKSLYTVNYVFNPKILSYRTVVSFVSFSKFVSQNGISDRLGNELPTPLCSHKSVCCLRRDARKPCVHPVRVRVPVVSRG